MFGQVNCNSNFWVRCGLLQVGEYGTRLEMHEEVKGATNGVTCTATSYPTSGFLALTPCLWY